MLNSTLELVVDKKTNPNVWKVDFFGNLDSYSLQSKKKEILDYIEAVEPEVLLFDFTGLNFINSESIGLVLHISEKLAEKKKKLVLVGAKKNVFQVLDVIGAFELVPHYKSYEDYLRAQSNANQAN